VEPEDGLLKVETIADTITFDNQQVATILIYLL